MLSWCSNSETDLDCYVVHRGSAADFVPSPGNLIASCVDTTYFIDEWHWNSQYYYKVAAMDTNGNVSTYALLRPEDVTGTDRAGAPSVTYLGQNSPNPFNPSTRITFGLKDAAIVSLRIYDVAGRLVRVLVAGSRPAGNYSELWNGKDSRGTSVASGIYFCRLDAGPFTQTRKMILLR
jgi:hypothetical protein